MIDFAALEALIATARTESDQAEAAVAELAAAQQDVVDAERVVSDRQAVASEKLAAHQKEKAEQVTALQGIQTWVGQEIAKLQTAS